MLDHYVVVKKIGKNKVTVLDPDVTRGKQKLKQKLKRSDFLKIWTGYVLFFAPGADFKPGEKQQHNLLKFLPLVLPHKRTLLVISLASVLLIVFGIVMANFYRYIMDEVIVARATTTLTLFSIGAIFIVLTQVIVEKIRGVLVNHFSFKIGLQLNFSYISHIFKLPLSFFDARKTGDILTRLSDIATIRALFPARLCLCYSIAY